MEKMTLIITTITLFILILVASWIFYRKIKLAQLNYEESKASVDTITFSFTRQIQKVETEIRRLIKEINLTKNLANEAINAHKINSQATLKGLEEIQKVDSRIDLIQLNLKEIKQEVKKLSEQPRQIIEQKTTEVDAPIPVQSEDIFKEVTETELQVLKLIVDLNEGTVPDIRKSIYKTREHTARLLKKLYEKGFIDRNTSSMPYRYYIRPEIKDILLNTKKHQTISL
jgi:hypothetical protein